MHLCTALVVGAALKIQRRGKDSRVQHGRGTQRNVYRTARGGQLGAELTLIG